MNKFLFSMGLCAGLLVLAACASSGTQAGGGGLTGKVWALITLNGKPLIFGTGISAQFTSDAKVSGSAGCNSYLGKYSVSDSTIAFGASIATTMKACPQPVMDQESAYLKMLDAARIYSVKGDQLSLANADNTTLATFKAQTQDLAGTNWEVVGYNDGRQAVVTVLSGTTITANFGTDGNLTGNAGCNDYNGSYTVNGDQITIGPLASMRKLCNDPEGVMDQEVQYLAALGTAATYRIDGNSLELRTKDGALAADFTKK
jgi:heat shock protein HslJ